MTSKCNPDSNHVGELFEAIEGLFETRPSNKQELKVWTVEINALIARVNALIGKTIYRPQ